MPSKKTVNVLLIAVTLCLTAVSAMATSQTKWTAVWPFHKIVAQGDMTISVDCISSPGVALTGRYFNQAKIKEKHAVLELSDQHPRLVNANGPTLHAEVMIQNGELQAVTLSKAAHMHIAACALAKNFKVNLATAAKLNVAGKVKRLDLNMQSATVFNNPADHFFVNIAKVVLANGARANLCDAKAIIGSVARGARINTNKTADVAHLTLNKGAEIDQRCRTQVHSQ